jgi:ubiquinone/menaquinone biosynthesis C-methylase UbiE
MYDQLAECGGAGAMTRADPYRLVARFYDRVLEPINAPLRGIARTMVEPQREWTVLDVGCGTGAALADYADLGCEVIGVDASPAMVSVARDRLGPDIELYDDVTDQIPVADDSVDLVHIGFVLHSLSQYEAVQLLQEISRVLKPTGHVVVIDFSAGGVSFPSGWKNRALSVVAEMTAGPTHARHSLSFHRSGGLDPLIAHAGLAVEASKVVGGGNMVVAALTIDDARSRATSSPG